MIELRQLSIKHPGNLSEFTSELRHNTEIVDLTWGIFGWETDKIWAGLLYENKFKIVRKTGIWKLAYSDIIVKGSVCQQDDFLLFNVKLGIHAYGLIQALLTSIVIGSILIYFELIWWLILYILIMIVAAIFTLIRLNNTENAFYKYLEKTIH